VPTSCRGGSLEQLSPPITLWSPNHVRRGTMTPQEGGVQPAFRTFWCGALGTQDQVEVDVDEQILLDGDSLLLCSDGLRTWSPTRKLPALSPPTKRPKQPQPGLTDLANEYGGEDNVTVIVIRIVPNPRDSWRACSGQTKPGGK